MGKMFGTDGIRGIANKELTPELAFRIGRIIAFLLGERSSQVRPFILLGRDTRISGSMLEGALVAGITSTGVDVHLLGVAPTPAVAFLTGEMEAAGGIMISASHNPMEDNGIKFFGAGGLKLDADLEEEAEKLFWAEDTLPRPTGGGVGRFYTAEQEINRYIDFLRGKALSLQGLKVVIDCANGSFCHIAPLLCSELGADVVPCNHEPDGVNINADCGSTNISLLQETVKKERAHIGLAFDGDGDRLIAVDEKGKRVDGDAILAVCGSYLKERGLLHGDTVVATVMSNAGLDLVGETKGFRVLRTNVGDRYVFEELQRGGYSLGGEQSGHIIFPEFLPTGDGLLTSLQLLKVIVEENEPLSHLAAIMKPFPQKLVNCRVGNKNGWENNKNITRALKLAQEKLNKKGRILIRASGTEPLIRIMVEGENEKLLEIITQELAHVVEQELGIVS
ncbi:MAG: phosphoglucosamine mutase [Dethiobacteria bacterium]|jgi:phosphoglucosamine mutase